MMSIDWLFLSRNSLPMGELGDRTTFRQNKQNRVSLVKDAGERNLPILSTCIKQIRTEVHVLP
jgi:hypothetical protein